MSAIDEMRVLNEKRLKHLESQFDERVEKRARQIADDRELSSVVWRACCSLFLVVLFVSLSWKLIQWCWS